MMDLRLAMMCGIDIPIPECQLIIHQPRIKDIAYVGEQDFFTGVQTFCIDKKRFATSQDEIDLNNTNNFQIFMTIMSKPEAADKKFAVQQILPLFFPDYKAVFTPRSLILSNSDSGQVMIDADNFQYLQDTMVKICCLKAGPMAQNSFNPADKKAEEIARKLQRGRERVAAEKGESNASIFSQYLSILTIGAQSMSLQELMNLTMFQLFDIMERYTLYVNWDIDIRSRLAGATGDKKPDDWMKSIH